MTDFLYPFIEGDERDGPSLLADLSRSAEAKAGESMQLRAATRTDASADLAAAVEAMAERFARGGRLFTFGNGGSATDAAGVAALFVSPPTGRVLPARSLAADEAVLTALGNDVGFDLVFARQLIAAARPGDMALALSTSGNSENLLIALAEARRRGVLAVGSAGYDGGRMAASGDLDHCIVVRSDSVHRIQETQAAVMVDLWRGVQQALDGPELGVT